MEKGIDITLAHDVVAELLGEANLTFKEIIENLTSTLKV